MGSGPRPRHLGGGIGHAIIEPMPANDRMPYDWSRRSLLVALLAGSVAALPGCRVRLENDAPRIPGLPTREPMPDEQALLSARWDALRLKEIATELGTSSTSLTRALVALHGRQAEVLDAVLRSGGVPAAEIKAPLTARTKAAPTPGTSASPTATSRAPSGVARLISGEAEGFSAEALKHLADLSKDRVALLGSMAAQRAAAVRLLGGETPDARLPTGPRGPTGDAAAAQLKAFRAAIYGFEVVASQTDLSHRAAAIRTLGLLRATSAGLRGLAGSAAGPIPLGYALPFPVSTPSAALKLAVHVMTGLREAIASQLPAVSGDAPGLAGTVKALTDVCVQAVTWRVPLTAFPGLTST